MEKPIKTIRDLRKVLNKAKTICELSDICESLSILKNIGCGSSRRVFEIKIPNIKKRCVLKVARDVRGRKQNRHEVRLIKKVGSEYLADIYKYHTDYLYLISEYAERSYSFAINDKIELLLENIDLVEAREFGITSSGKIKLIDYGLSEKIYYKYY